MVVVVIAAFASEAFPTLTVAICGMATMLALGLLDADSFLDATASSAPWTTIAMPSGRPRSYGPA